MHLLLFLYILKISFSQSTLETDDLRGCIWPMVEKSSECPDKQRWARQK